MATSYIMIGHSSILQGVLLNIATDFKNKTTEIDFEALVRKFCLENNLLYGAN